MKARVWIFAFAMTSVLPHAVAQDSREAAARRLAQVMVIDLIPQMEQQIGQRSRPAERERARLLFSEQYRKDLEAAMIRAVTPVYIRHFTVQEMDAMSNFYSSDAGRSVSRKQAGMQAEIMQSMARELRALSRQIGAEQGQKVVP